MERHFRRVDFVVGAVVDVGMNADHRISAQLAGLHRFLNTCVDSRDVFLRNRSADHRALEGVQVLAVRIHRRKDNLAVSVLAAAAGLLGILVFLVDFFAECFLVGNLRCADIGLYVELAQKSVHDDLQMELAHTGNDRLARLRIGVLLECRIFFSKLSEGNTQLLLTGFGLRLDCKLDNRLREFH